MESMSPFGNDPKTAILVVVAAILCLVILIASILVGSRRQRFHTPRHLWMVTGLACSSVVVVCGLVVLGTHAGRALILEALEGVDPTQKATLLAPCGGACSVNAHRFFGGIALAVLGLLGAVCMSSCWWKRCLPGPARRIAVIMAIGLGCAFTVMGGGMAYYQLTMNDVFAAVAPLDPALKLPKLLVGLKEIGQLSGLIFPILASLLTVTGVLVVVALTFGQQGQRITIGPGGMVLALLVLFLGAALFLITRGHARDWDRALSFRYGNQPYCLERYGGSDGTLTPPPLVQGARRLERGPVIIVSASTLHDDSHGEVLLDGSNVAHVRSLMSETRPRWQPIRSLVKGLEGERSSRPILWADKKTPVKVLEHLVASCVASGHRALQLAGAKTEVLQSDVLEGLTRKGCHGVSVEITSSPAANAVKFRSGESFVALAGRIEEAARKAGVAQLVVPRELPPLPPDPDRPADGSGLAKRSAEVAAKEGGVLGLLKGASDSHLASIFGKDTALGKDTQDALGGLIGDKLGESYGLGGIGLVSGRGISVRMSLGKMTVKGALDRKTVHRIIRRHINEVKYCCNRKRGQITKKRGRVVIQLTIAASGQVVSATVASSNVKAPEVETCITRAVRRWLFPRPKDGGVVKVSPTFELRSAR